MTNRYRHIFVLLSQLVLTVPNSTNFRKGGDHLRIKDNMQKLTDNHTQKNQKGKDHVFEKADRFTERQKEKEAQAAKTEKAGKEQPDQKPKTKKHDMEL